MSRVWHLYIRTSFATQIAVSLTIIGLVTLLFVVALMVAQNGTPNSAPRILQDLLLDNPDGEISKTAKGIYQTILILVLAVWQAVFLARLLTRPHDFRFSKKMALYPYNKLKGKRSAPILVFRLMNDGIADLFNVEIEATLVVFNPVHNVVQHFRCNVINNRIPIFRTKMPFWIAIETGEVMIKWGDDAMALDRCFLFRVNRKNSAGVRVIDKAYVKRVAHEASIPERIFSLSIYVHGHDIELDQEKAAATTYLLTDIEPGFFKDINPISNSDSAEKRNEMRFFSEKEIETKYDAIEPY